MKSKRLSTRDVCHIAIFTAIIAVVSQINIPMPAGVPMTLQTFIIPLAGLVLGTKRGTIATVVYVLLGAVGVPVFTGFQGGIGVVLGVTGGFIVSFPLLAAAAGIGMKAALARRGGTADDGVNSLRMGRFGFYRPIHVGLIAGAVLNYLVGMLWFSVVTKTTLSGAFTMVVLPFLITTVIKIAIAAWLGPKLRIILVKAGVL